MFSIGRKKINFLLALLVYNSVNAQVHLPDSGGKGLLGDSSTGNSSIFVPSTSKDRPLEGSLPQNTYSVPGYKGEAFSKPTFKQEVLSLGDSALPGAGLNMSTYKENKNREIFNKIYYKYCISEF